MQHWVDAPKASTVQAVLSKTKFLLMLLSERVQPQFHYHDLVVALVTFLHSHFWMSTAALEQVTGL